MRLRDSVSQCIVILQVAALLEGRSKNCSTNIGNVAAQKGASSGRYGPKIRIIMLSLLKAM